MVYSDMDLLCRQLPAGTELKSRSTVKRRIHTDHLHLSPGFECSYISATPIRLHGLDRDKG